jgi:hypothetical protein
MSASQSSAHSVSGPFDVTRALEVTTSGSIVGTCSIAALSKAGELNPEVEIGQWRFRLKIVRGASVPGTDDEYIQCFLYNYSHMELRTMISLELVNATHKCLRKLVPLSSTFSRLAHGDGWGYTQLMLRSVLTSPSNNFVENGHFYIRANLVIAHPETECLCSYGKEQLRYNAVSNSIVADFAAIWENEAVPPDFCIVATNPPCISNSGMHLEEVRVPTHKVILAARSPVFRAMLSSGMQEASADEMEITSQPLDAVKAFSRFLYCDACTEEALEDYAWELLALADKYDVPALRCVCETHLVTEIYEENALHTLARAHTLGASMLKQQAIGYIVTTGKQLLKKPRAHELLGSELLLEVMSALVDTVDAVGDAKK